jgi:o-succinylbenzoate synthase
MARLAARVTARRASVPAPVGSAHAAQRERAGLVLELTDDAGCTGRGEASPLPGFSLDDIASSEAALRAFETTGLEVSDDPACISLELERVGALVPEACRAARFAVETACLDWVGMRRGIPARSLLGGARDVPPLGLAALLRADSDDDALLDSATSALERGVAAVKVKLGFLPFDAELGRLGRLRAQLGPNIPIRLDVNATWTASDAVPRLAALATISPEFVEDPVIARDLDALDRSAVPVALDETLLDLRVDGLNRVVDRIPVAVLILKPMALGGLCRCLDLARWAARRGVDVVVSHLFDGPIALAAAAALAQAAGSPGRAMGLDPHAALAAWPRSTLPMFRAGSIIAVDRPGLGLDFDDVEGRSS